MFVAGVCPPGSARGCPGLFGHTVFGDTVFGDTVCCPALLRDQPAAGGQTQSPCGALREQSIPWCVGFPAKYTPASLTAPGSCWERGFGRVREPVRAWDSPGCVSCPGCPAPAVHGPFAFGSSGREAVGGTWKLRAPGSGT